MASSGNIKGGTYGGGHLWLTFDWSQSSQSVSNNTTTISWSLKLNWNASLNFSASKSYSVSVNGTNYSGKYTGGGSGSSGVKTIKSGTTTITHNANGTKSFSVNATFNIAVTYSGVYISSMSLSGSGTLNTIPRASSITSLTNSVIINGANAIAVSINRKASSFTHTVKFSLGSYSQSFSSVATYQSLTIPITWLNALASVSSLSGSCTITTYNGSTQIGSSATAYFTAYRPASSTLSLSPSSIICNGTNTIGVHISRANSYFTHTVTWAFGSYNKSTSSVATSTSYAIPQSWLNAIPNNMSGTGTVTVITYYGNINLGSHSANFSLTIPDNAKPTLISVADTIINPSTITDWDIYLKNISNCQLNINASGTLGSTISKIYVNNTATSQTHVDNTLNASGDKSYSVYVIDSRGRTSNTIVKTIHIVDYEIPTLKVNKIYRCLEDGSADDEGTCVIINATYTMSSCNGNNTMTRTIQHKETTDSYYTEDGSFDTDVDIILDQFAMNKTYDFLISVMDGVGKSAVYTGDGIIPTAIAIIDILNGGKGIAFGKMASEENIIDCDWGIKTPQVYDENGTPFLDKLYRIGDIIISTVSENPAEIYGGTWELLCPGRTLVCIDTAQSEFNAVKKTGGVKTHTLTTTEMPPHIHTQNAHYHSGSVGTRSITGTFTAFRGGRTGVFTQSGNSEYTFGGSSYKRENIKMDASHNHTISINNATAINNSAGGGQAHNNLQPFMTVYMWVKTA